MKLWRAVLERLRRPRPPDDLKRAGEPDEPHVAAIPYPTADVLGERAAAHGDAEPPPED